MVRVFVRTGFVLLALAFVGCAAGSKSLQKEVSKLRGELQSLRTYQAEQSAELTAIRGDMRKLSGQFEELEYQQRIGKTPGISELKDNLSDLERRIPPPPIVPVAALERDELYVENNLPEDVKQLLATSFLHLRKGAYRDALPLLTNASDLSYGEDWAAIIFFWFGVAYDGIGDNRKALGAYHEVVSRFPKHSRASLALLRQASVFIRLGDSNAAKLTLKKITSDYPQSSEAAAAKKRISDLS